MPGRKEGCRKKRSEVMLKPGSRGGLAAWLAMRDTGHVRLGQLIGPPGSLNLTHLPHPSLQPCQCITSIPAQRGSSEGWPASPP